jgi:hypothetical protein
MHADFTKSGLLQALSNCRKETACLENGFIARLK